MVSGPRRICPVCGKRPVVYANALGCSPACDFAMRTASTEPVVDGELDPFELGPDPFELPESDGPGPGQPLGGIG
jgi:hypothetical protein